MVVRSATPERGPRRGARSIGTSLALAFGNVALAQEGADEGVSRALERWDRVAVMDSPAAWLYRVAFNDARRRLPSAGLERRLLGRQRVEWVDPPGGELWALVADLPTRQRPAVVLRHVGQLRELEIGTAMGISRGTVFSTLRAAYQSLRIALADPEPATEAR